MTSVAWQTGAGAWALTVVCKATYRLEPGEAKLAEQEAPNEEDKYWDNDETKSLYAPSDLAPFKARAEVLLVGHAYAPWRAPVRAMVARLKVGEVDKAVEAWCDRGFGHDGRLLEGPRFVKMPLRYERAAGGPGTSNPAGMRYDGPPDRYGMVRIPNLQPTGCPIAQRGDRFEPIGFGPIAPQWPGRVERLYHRAARWSHRRWFERPLPEDVDPAYFNAAPRDQWVESIRPDERIVLEGLHPDHSPLVTRLPGIRPCAVVEGAGRESEELSLAGDTLWIDTDRGLCAVTWRGRVDLRHPEEAGRVVVSTEVSGGAIRKSQPPVRFGADEATSTYVLQLSDVGQSILKPALPFAAGASPAGEQARWADRPVVARLVDDGTGTPVAPMVAGGQEVLPFTGGTRDEDEEVEASTRRPPDVTVDGEGAPLPGLPEAPPMIGPLATLEMGERAKALPEPVVVKKVETEAEAPEPRPALKAALEKPTAEEFPLERCATITASIARRREEKARILEKNELTTEQWADIEKHWAEAIKKDLARGKVALLRRFDAAYVGQLEKERGVIQVEEYARLTVAAERGTLAAVLEELSLPRGAVMRVERVWVANMGEEAALGERVRKAVDGARGAIS